MAQTARTVQVPELAAARLEPMEVTCRTQRPGLDWGRGRSQEPRPTGKVTSTHCVVSVRTENTLNHVASHNASDSFFGHVAFPTSH